MTIDSMAALLPQIKSGKLRALAVAYPQRAPALPDVPTIAETYPGFDASPMNYLSVRDDLAAGRLRRILPGYRASHVEFDNGIYAVFQKSRHMSAKVRAFIDYLAEAFEQRLR